jgi:hypothetical protein
MIDMRLAAVVVVCLAAPGAADPPKVDLSRCTAFDATALRRALARELPNTGGDTPFAVIAVCPDLVTAHLHVEPVPTDGPIARSLDLGEVRGDLRIKLLAIAIAELAEVVASLPVPTAVGATTPELRAYGDPRDPQSLSNADPKTTPPSAPPPPRRDPPAPAASAAKRVAVDDGVMRDAPPAIARTAREPIELGPVAGVRVFSSTRTVMADLGAELALPWFRVGIRGAVGDAHDVLGSLHLWLATATAARELVCAGPGCALVRVEAGMVGAVARAAASATASNASTGYAQGSLAVELRHRFSGWTAAATLDAGFAAGMSARAAERVVTSMAGFVAFAGVGARWH